MKLRASLPPPSCCGLLWSRTRPLAAVFSGVQTAVDADDLPGDLLLFGERQQRIDEPECLFDGQDA